LLPEPYTKPLIKPLLKPPLTPHFPSFPLSLFPSFGLSFSFLPSLPLFFFPPSSISQFLSQSLLPSFSQSPPPPPPQFRKTFHLSLDNPKNPGKIKNMRKPFTKKKISGIRSKAWIEDIVFYHTLIWYKKRTNSSITELYDIPPAKN